MIKEEASTKYSLSLSLPPSLSRVVSAGEVRYEEGFRKIYSEMGKEENFKVLPNLADV